MRTLFCDKNMDFRKTYSVQKLLNPFHINNRMLSRHCIFATMEGITKYKVSFQVDDPHSRDTAYIKKTDNKITQKNNCTIKNIYMNNNTIIT